MITTNGTCKRVKNIKTEKHIKTAEEVKQIGLNMTDQVNITEAYFLHSSWQTDTKKSENIVLKYDNFYSMIGANYYSSRWYITIFTEQNDLFHEADAGLYSSGLNIRETKKQFEKMADNYKNLYKNYTENIIPVVAKIQDYLLGKITKKKLHRLLEESTFLFDDLFDVNAILNDNVNDLIKLVEYLKENTVKAYEQIVKFKVPILNTHSVYELKMVQLAEDVDDGSMQEMVESLKYSLDPGLTRLTHLTFQRILETVTEVRDEIVQPIEDFIEEIKGFSNSLVEYERSTIMNIEFFMYVCFQDFYNIKKI